MSEEIFDVCDAQDNVIGQLPRSQVHAQKRLHRAVHIWVWNSSGELLLQLRSATKDQFPNCYTSSASGHVDAGEGYEESAVRELGEELQLSGNGRLKWGAKLAASAETAYEHTVLFHLQTDETVTPDPAEIAEVEYFSPMAIAEMLSQRPEMFSPPFRQLFEDWQQRQGSAAD